MKVKNPFKTARHLVRQTKSHHGWLDPFTPTAAAVFRGLEFKALSREVRGAIRRMLRSAYDSVPVPSTPSTLAQRLDRRLIHEAMRVVDQLPAGADHCHFRVVDRDIPRRLALISGSWWQKYSQRAGSWHHVVSIIAGYEDGQRWAKRVPTGTSTVAEALDYLKPAAVKAAESNGLTVLRQGDVWLVQRRQGVDDMSALDDTDHLFDPTSRVIRHPEHGSLALPDGAPFRAYGSKSTTRSIGRSLRND